VEEDCLRSRHVNRSEIQTEPKSGGAGKSSLGLSVLGIDLAADPAHTGVATLTVETNRVVVMAVAEKGSDDLLVDLAKRADLTGVDAPLGWPDYFISALNRHQRGEPWPAADDPIQQRRLLSKRRTDRLVKEITGIDPLSVAADRIAAVAMRCARLQTLWADEWGGLEDRAGRGRLVETYPAAALKLWGLAHRSYKGKDGARGRRTNSPKLGAIRSQHRGRSPLSDGDDHASRNGEKQ
jgi:hypothetical protein